MRQIGPRVEKICPGQVILVAEGWRDRRMERWMDEQRDRLITIRCPQSGALINTEE